MVCSKLNKPIALHNFALHKAVLTFCLPLLEYSHLQIWLIIVKIDSHTEYTWLMVIFTSDNALRVVLA
jgi:hypothetical protein